MCGLNASRRAGGVEGFESLVPKSDYHAVLYRVSIRDTSLRSIKSRYDLPSLPDIRPVAVVSALALSLPIALVLTMIEGRRLLLPG